MRRATHSPSHSVRGRSAYIRDSTYNAVPMASVKSGPKLERLRAAIAWQCGTGVSGPGSAGTGAGACVERVEGISGLVTQQKGCAALLVG